MKGLLHSKYFKTNLKRWLFMYVGVMLLFTTVVTYSKYISSINVSDEAREAKFNVKIFESTKTGEECKNCEHKYLPNNEFDLYFTVDTSELEVKTKLVVTVETRAKLKDGSNMFTIKNISNYTDPSDVIEFVGSSKDDDDSTFTNMDVTKNNIYIMVNPNDVNRITTYKVTLKYAGTFNRNTSFKDPLGDDIKYEVINLSYSAVQKIN